MRRCLFIFLLFYSFHSFSQNKLNSALLNYIFLTDTTEVVKKVVADTAKYHLQIIYSQITRDKYGYPSLKKHYFNVNPHHYFYPASLAKVPMVFAAIDRINSLNNDSISVFSPIISSSKFSPPMQCNYDVLVNDKDSLFKSYCSPAWHIKNVFAISDNTAPNYLFELTGLDYINSILQKSGFKETVINTRFARMDSTRHKKTEDVYFLNYSNDTLGFIPSYKTHQTYKTNLAKMLAGKSHFNGHSVVPGAYNFEGENYISLENINDLIACVMFPELNIPIQNFNFTISDIYLLRKEMGLYPRESDYPSYQFKDSHRKFLLLGDNKTSSENIRIYNKVGLAYGFISDCAYIVDYKNEIEFMLSAVLYVNKNEVINDGIYEYETIGIPFLANLGRLILNFEKSQKMIPEIFKKKSILLNKTKNNSYFIPEKKFNIWVDRIDNY